MEEIVITLGRGPAARSASPASQKFADSLGQEERATKVDADHSIETLLRRFEQVFTLGWGDAGIVHQKVNPREAVDHRLQQLLAPARSGNIPGEGIEGSSGIRRRCRLAQLLAFGRRIAVRRKIDGDAVAGASQSKGDSPADSSRRAGHQCNGRWSHH